MSHSKERKEKICLNCNAELYGRFCHVCGQENVEPKETVWHLINHFISDITHFDGKFFSTTKYLLLKPGFLSLEYLRGRRASYLNPIRMYVFTSAIFFIIFFSIENKSSPQDENLKVGVTTSKDSLSKSSSNKNKFNIISEGNDIDEPSKGQDSLRVLEFDALPATVAAYDSAQSKLPPEKKDGWLKRNAIKKLIEINEKHKGESSKEFNHELLEKFTHSVPQMMFVSLPIAALILQLLYVRRKQFYYVNHGIFVIHVYIAAYIFFLLSYLSEFFYNSTHLAVFSIVKQLIFLCLLFYIYKAMRNFYQQGRGKTILKFFILIFSYLILIVFLIAVFFVTSLFQI